jgi:hypothetical protein
MRLSTVVLMLSFGAVAVQAQDIEVDGGIPIATALITPGRYIAPRPSYFENVLVRNWFGKTLLEGSVLYGNKLIPFSAELKQDASSPDSFVANGYINQRWTSGATCQIAITIEVQREKNALNFRSYQPSAIQLEAPAGRECVFYNNYIWSFHAKPYVMSVE